MKKKNRYRILLGMIGLLAIILLSSCSNMIVLNSKGSIGNEESFLIKTAFILMLIVVLPVFVMVVWFSIRYRASNKRSTYKPNWAHSNKIEWVIWSVPIAIVASLSYLTWVKTHELDPYKPIKSEIKPLKIEVVSTDWNWLFIYPDYNIAVANHLVFPANTPLQFKLTSASVMTAFFIPQLGSQIYAMAGMKTELNLMANHPGTYWGRNFEYSGHGYVDMHFDAVATSQKEFDNWIAKAKQSPTQMSLDTFNNFREPKRDFPVTTYSSVAPKLFDHIMMEYMGWMGCKEHGKMTSDEMPGMSCNKKTDECHCSMTAKPDSGYVHNTIMEDK